MLLAGKKPRVAQYLQNNRKEIVTGACYTRIEIAAPMNKVWDRISDFHDLSRALFHKQERQAKLKL